MFDWNLYEPLVSPNIQAGTHNYISSYSLPITSQLIFICLKSTIETLEKGVRGRYGGKFQLLYYGMKFEL